MSTTTRVGVVWINRFLYIFILFTGLSTFAWGGVQDELKAHPAIPLLDENGAHVLDSGEPYSPRMSCGTQGCHDYDSITHSYHFETGRDEARDDFGVEQGLPQLVSPGYYGGYACMGGSNPEILAKKVNASLSDFADHGSAGLVKRCAGCHAGGGWMEKDRNGRRYDEVDPSTVAPLDGDYFTRGYDSNNQEADTSVISQWDWKKSGVVENDCLLCHAKLSELKSPEGVEVSSRYQPQDVFRTLRRTALIREQGQFRYAASAILEFLNLNTGGDPANDKTLLSFSREDSDGDGKIAIEELALNAEGLPAITWNPDAFDADRKVVIPMLSFPDNDSCMQCHRTSNSRRGFYGFGESAEMTYSEGGLLEEDYQDDVHKGKTWTEPNGETRNIENCNACHSRNYYNPVYSNVDLDADHDFLKGNSDMDVANNRDYAPPPKSCVYCHDQAPNPAIPSGHENMLAAHRERWKLGGDMSGYPADTLDRITQTHLDNISCEACHITEKKSRGRAIQIMYRYAASEDGVLRIRPYNPRIRYYWKDKTTGYVLNRTERNSVFRAETAADGTEYGALIDPSTGAQLATVSVRMSHGRLRFGDPEDYEGWKALKQAYDSVLAAKGISNPDAVLVWTESNAYVMSHNTRPAVQSLQCEQCHARKQDGSISPLVSAEGLLGEQNKKTVTTLPDKRLVDEGIIVFDYPYMKVDASGEVTESISNILYYSRQDPSLSRLKSAISPTVVGTLESIDADTALQNAGIDADDATQLQPLMGTPRVYQFMPRHGDPSVRQVAILSAESAQALAVLPTYRFLVGIADDPVKASAVRSTGMSLSQVFKLEATDANSNPVRQFPGTPLFLKFPWSGSDEKNLNVVTSEDGTTWHKVDAADIVASRPKMAAADGYVVIRTDHFSYYGVSDSSDGESTESTTSSSGGGGAVLYLPLLLMLIGMGRGMFNQQR